MNIAAVILAAGGSRRMGAPKQLLPVDGQPMLARVVQQACAAQLGAVIVVLGAARRAIQPLLVGYPVIIAVNRRWRSGLASSLRVGLAHVPADADGVLFVPGDMPYLRADTLRQLASLYYTAGMPIVAPTYRGRRGNPVLFGRALFGELAALTGDAGGRALLAKHAHEIALLDVENDSILRDIDTPADYAPLSASAA